MTRVYVEVIMKMSAVLEDVKDDERSTILSGMIY